MNEYTVVPLDQVRPGDVAVCNGREFPVVEWFGQAPWVVKVAGSSYSCEWTLLDALGFEFRRAIPREPRTFRRCVVLNRDGNYDTSYSIENEVPAGHYAKNIGGTYFLADITEVMP